MFVIEGLENCIERFPVEVFIVMFLMFVLILSLIYRYGYMRKRTRKMIALLCPDHMLNTKECEQRIVNLAETHHLIRRRSYNFIIWDRNQLAYNRLNEMRHYLSNVSTEIISLIPAARWMFDNFYMMYRELKKIKTTGTSHKNFPVLTSGEFVGYPRIYIIAREMVYVSGGYLTQKNISDMLQTYQNKTKLTSSELWAVQEILGLCLLEAIINVANDILKIIRTKAAADAFVRQKLDDQINGADISSILSHGIPAQYARDNAFHSHVIYCLKNMSVDESQIYHYVELWAGNTNPHLKPTDIFEKEVRFESNLEATIRSLIVSLREVNEINGKELFEEVSPVEKILRQDPSQVYAKMDFDTRNNYRRRVEKLALRYKMQEWNVAEKVVHLASANKDNDKIYCSEHIGAYLVGKGKYALLDLIQNRPAQREPHLENHYKEIFYFFSIAMWSLLFLMLLMSIIGGSVYTSHGFRINVFMLVILFPIFGIAIEITNQIYSKVIAPKILPSLDFSNEIPDEYRTYVVMPVIITDKEQAKRYAKRLEKHYISNKQNNLYFAILGDFSDAPSQVMPQDDLIMKDMKDAIQALNLKYPSAILRFSLFIRFRKWNESENCWMGWERKRGKLEEFNAMICGEEETTFSLICGDRSHLSTFKYVITLDSDTDLIRDSASKFIGILAHPLNRAQIDPTTNKVKEGYAIIQPVIRNHILSSNSGHFSKIFSGQAGLDPYSNAISDIYQDIFDKGIFKGKGIYDVRIMHQILRDSLPENSVLSHDLLESCFVRCAFASTVKLLDIYPSTVLSFAKREHRWIRGDWQLLPWLFGKSPICGVSKWKIFDNLKRSMRPIFQLAAILVNAFLLPEVFYLWILIVFFRDALRILTLIFNTAVQKIVRPKLEIVYLDVFKELFSIIKQALFSLVLLPFRAWISIDAIVRTLYRLAVSHKRMLQWKTSEASEITESNALYNYYLKMWAVILPGAALFAAIFIVRVNFEVKIAFAGLGILWIGSPYCAYLLSLRKKTKIAFALKAEDALYLRVTARRTWQYFKEMSTAENNWLCPDNYQLSPQLKVSDKTSPTNIGLQLLSVLSARDLGHIGLKSMTDRLENILYTIAVLPKWHGHLYNWYNVRTLEVLYPPYISTVDSGNFVGYLLTLKNGLIKFLDQPVFPEGMLEGIMSTSMIAGFNPDLTKTYASGSEYMNALYQLKASITDIDEITYKDRKWIKEALSECNDLIEEAKVFNLQETSYSMQKNSYTMHKTLREFAQEGLPVAQILMNRINGLITTLENMVLLADFKPLFNQNRMLFHIGYHESSQKMDSGCYDLMASEASLTSFIAIAKGEVPQRHWYRLGRPLTIIRGIPAFVSWSGSMFEYLMPSLVMKEYTGSVFNETSRAAVKQHILFGKKNNIPWGISESQYYRFDMNSNYQYKAFGVPKLRLQPALKISLVVAPYATFLALCQVPNEAMKNIHHLREIGAEGDYGFYEAIDFNSPNPDSMKPYSIVKCFMAHHQGMILASINNLLNNNIMQRRFHSDPLVLATESLLEETRETNLIAITRKGYNIQINQMELQDEVLKNRYVHQTALTYPRAHWLSNKNYSVMMTSDGDGFSKYKDKTVNRWRSDLYASSGNYIYVRDVNSKKYWSAAYKPTQIEPDHYQVTFSYHQIEFTRQDGDIATHTEISLSSTQNVEIRKVTLTNHGSKMVILEVTSYLEVVADHFLSELSHPAFNKLFIESEYVADHAALIAKRRGSTESEKMPYLIHMVNTEDEIKRNVQYETDRKRFLGRNNTPAKPEMITGNCTMSNIAGFSVDPIMSLRMMLYIPEGKSLTITFITGMFNTRDEALEMCEAYSDPNRVENEFEQFRLQSKLELKYLNINSSQLNAFQDLIGPIFYPSAPYRGPAENLRRNWKNQSFLWRFGVSGDNPMLILRVNSIEEVGIVKDVLLAYEYLRINNVKVDLILLTEGQEGYMQDLTALLMDMTSTLKIYDESISKPSLFILHKSQMQPAEVDLLMTVASVVFTEKTGIYFRTIREQIEQAFKKNAQKNAINPQPELKTETTFQRETEDASKYEFYNGFGGFVNHGREYEIVLDGQQKPPMPWINVIANDQFGFQISESGAGFTWSVNSRENKITSWSNDPVSDPAPEVLYVQDEDAGTVFSPVSLGRSDRGAFRVRHGFGYSIFEHEENDIDMEMVVFVPTDEPLKLWKLTLKNNSETARKLVLTLYVEWILGVNREFSAPYVVTSYNAENSTLYAKSIYNYSFRRNKSFIFSSETISGYTGDRKEFLGANGSVRQPYGLSVKLSGKTGVALDPCGVIQSKVSLAPGEKTVVIFGLGQSAHTELLETRYLKYRDPHKVEQALDQVKQYWHNLTQSVVVKTNDRALDIMANGWLLYQTLACRIKARAAFYQCGGAYGYRDQLQDVLALLDSKPDLVRSQILTACSRQFEEGDVQHWWHPPEGVGVRTRITDDLLWLPYVTAAYIKHTGDYAVLEEKIAYLSGPELKPEEHEIMYVPQTSDQTDSVYAHCLRAIDHTSFGIHGLPLMGGGDWNDGMNRVGIEGKGESVWLGWFQYAVLNEFLPLCLYKNDLQKADALEHAAKALQKNIEAHGWDGAWYLRAFYDDGQKLGSAENSECRMDSISQSWSVISGAGRYERSLKALNSADQYLIKKELGVSLLLAPPFDKTEKNPGYIKNYYPGMRENGGQYTHAAIWLAIANTMVKDGKSAYNMLTMLNPVHLTALQKDAIRYEKEPYVMIADISMAEPYVGRGGWSWYTGSAGWMYQAIVRWFLGIRREGETLLIDPATPPYFGEYSVDYKFGDTLYQIIVLDGGLPGQRNFSITVDGAKIKDNHIPLVNDALIHKVMVVPDVKNS